MVEIDARRFGMSDVRYEKVESLWNLTKQFWFHFVSLISIIAFMLLGYSPELVQGAFRAGDSVTNIITPLMSYFPLILTFAQKYEPKAGIGTMIATMLPYSIWFTITWTALLIAWIALGIPMGPGTPLFLAK